METLSSEHRGLTPPTVRDPPGWKGKERQGAGSANESRKSAAEKHTMTRSGRQRPQRLTRQPPSRSQHLRPLDTRRHQKPVQTLRHVPARSGIPKPGDAAVHAPRSSRRSARFTTGRARGQIKRKPGQPSGSSTGFESRNPGLLNPATRLPRQRPLPSQNHPFSFCLKPARTASAARNPPAPPTAKLPVPQRSSEPQPGPIPRHTAGARLRQPDHESSFPPSFSQAGGGQDQALRGAGVTPQSSGHGMQQPQFLK